MATREEIYQAILNADKAGDSASVKALGAYLKTMPDSQPAQDIASVTSLGAGLGKGVGTVALGAQHYLGKGLQALGGLAAPEQNLSSLVTGQQPQNIVQRAGGWLVNDAAAGKQKLTNELAPYKAANPLTAGAGELTGEVLATLPVGGVVAKPLLAASKYAPALAPLAQSVASSGMRAGGVTGAAGLATRSVGGGIAGAASAGLVDPENANAGGVIGMAAPGALQLAGKVGSAVGQKVSQKLEATVGPEVAALARRAKELGIDIPADRLVNSRAMNAVTAGLNYVPFSGRAATEARMSEQLNQAASRLIGQNTPNMTQAIRKAGDELGAKFDVTLRNTGVAVDKQMLDDVARVFNTAERELGSDALKPIASQVDDLIAKGASGVIDGQAAYNIKRTLDRIGRGNNPTAYHALELKGVLMDALNRSLGPDGAKAFATTRQQYSNMLALEKLARNGVEGELSVARLANMGNINNQPLQELADIAAQFVKAREGQHGAAQRAFVGLGIGSVGGPAALAAGSAVGRTANGALNSNALRNAMTGAPQIPGPFTNALMSPAAQEALLRAAPVVGPSGYGR